MKVPLNKNDYNFVVFVIVTITIILSFILIFKEVHGCQPYVEKVAENPSFPFDPVVDTPLGRIEGSWGLSENGNRYSIF